jgi:hypothetical protein
MKRPATLYDLLVAWQAGQIGYREAMERAQIETLDELYEAAHASGVTISPELTPAERRQAAEVVPLLRRLERRKAA